jgi:serine/threonine-protein kinase
LDAVFTRALARDPKKRFASCEAFGLTLAAELEGPRVTFLATPAGARPSIFRATRKWQNGIALVAVAVIITLLMIGRFNRSSPADAPSLKSGAKPVASMQRVVPPPTPKPLQSSPSNAPSASATSSTSVSVAPTSSSGPLLDP